MHHSGRIAFYVWSCLLWDFGEEARAIRRMDDGEVDENAFRYLHEVEDNSLCGVALTLQEKAFYSVNLLTEELTTALVICLTQNWQIMFMKGVKTFFLRICSCSKVFEEEWKDHDGAYASGSDGNQHCSSPRRTFERPSELRYSLFRALKRGWAANAVLV